MRHARNQNRRLKGAATGHALLGGLVVGALCAAIPLTGAPSAAGFVSYQPVRVIASGLGAPIDVAVDGDGNVFVPNTTDGQVSEFPRAGTGFAAPVALPFGTQDHATTVAVDPAGDVFAVFYSNGGTASLLELPRTSNGFGAPVSVPMSAGYTPDGVAVDSQGNVFLVSDLNGQQPLVEIPMTAAGYGTQVSLPYPNQHLANEVSVDRWGNVYVVDYNSGVFELPRSGAGWGQLSGPLLPDYSHGTDDVTIDGNGDVLVDNADVPGVLEAYKGADGYSSSVVLPFTGLSYPRGIAVDSNGDIFVVDQQKGELLELPSNSPTATCSSTLPSGTVVGMAETGDGRGYWIASSTGEVAACGDARVFGNWYPGVVGIAAAPNGDGYWLVTGTGLVKAFGSAIYRGDVASVALSKPIVAMAADPRTGGYWLLGGDGGVFSFNAPFYGSTGDIGLVKPAVGLEATPDGRGYRFVASDGGIFDYGDARFYGSLGSVKLAAPVVGMADDPVTGGYWLDAADGGSFAFHAPFYGSTGDVALARPCVGMSAMPDGSGYRFVASDGGIFDFHAPFEGSTA